MRKILSFVLCLVMLCSVLSLAGCKDENAVGQSWKVVKIGEEEQTYAQKVGFKVTRNSTSIGDVWLNVEKIEGTSATLQITKYQPNTETDDDIYDKGSPLDGGNIVLSAKQVEDANKNSKGWIKLNTKSWDLTSDNVLLTIVDGRLTIREIVFVNNKGVQLTADINVAYVGIKTEKKGDPIIKQYTKAQLLEYAETSLYGIPNFLLDDQESFKTKDN